MTFFQCIYHFLIKPIILRLLEIVTLAFTMYILTILTWSLKMYVIGKRHWNMYVIDFL